MSSVPIASSAKIVNLPKSERQIEFSSKTPLSNSIALLKALSAIVNDLVSFKSDITLIFFKTMLFEFGFVSEVAVKKSDVPAAPSISIL